jgi:hypothetical protein
MPRGRFRYRDREGNALRRLHVVTYLDEEEAAELERYAKRMKWTLNRFLRSCLDEGLDSRVEQERDREALQSNDRGAPDDAR